MKQFYNEDVNIREKVSAPEFGRLKRMGIQRLRRAAYRLVTGLVLLTVFATTFLPDWVSSTQAAPAAVNATAGTETVSPDNPGSATRPPAVASEALVPMNALVLGQAGRVDALEKTITDAGGYVYARQDDALFVGLNALSEAELAPAGARAVYRGTVSGEAYESLAPADREVVALWNNVVAEDPLETRVVNAGTGHDTAAYVAPAEPMAESGTRAALAPTSEQTSTFLAGSVTVEVVFVESTSDAEKWTANEISKAKAEVVDAVNWWTVAATAPDPDDVEGTPRPQAFLDWNLQFHSPLEGTTVQRDLVKVSVEPIDGTILTAQDSWMIELAEKFTGQAPGTGSPASLRSWAHMARTNAATDWGFVLFVVDSSADGDGRFADGKAAGALVNGPWAVVTYDAGDLGINNLEIYIAKMVGHVFGAGDEWYDPMTEEGCHSDPLDYDSLEYFGYLRVAHENCEYGDFMLRDSIMRAGNDMVYAYRNYAISNPARGQVGWMDRNDNGVYDVIDTLYDTFEGAIEPVCPSIHLANIPVLNQAALPDTFGLAPGGGEGDANGWWSYVYNPATAQNEPAVKYTQANINRVGHVWGRINGGEWISATPADGVAWDSEDEGYNIILPGKPGTTNTVEIGIMNRWGGEAWLTPSPIGISLPDVPASDRHESNDPAGMELFFANAAPGGWSDAADPGYSGGNTKIAGGTGREACFGFSGTEASIVYNNLSNATASVYVDGELHSTIQYFNTGAKQLKHTVANLPDAKHSVSVIANAAGVDIDAYEVTDTVTANVIDSLDPGDISDPDGFYEDTGSKIQYEGNWSIITPYSLNNNRQGTPDDSARRSITPNDRIYFFFTNTDTIAIYRSVFPNGGSADVYINGEMYGTMYNSAAKEQVTPYYVSGLSAAITYTVEIRVNEDTPYFELDALRFLNLRDLTAPDLYVVGPGEDPLDVGYAGAQEQYGVWEDKTTFIRSRDEGDVMNVYFKGSAIAVQRETAGSRGVMELYVDGKLMRLVDNSDKRAKDTPVIVHGLDPNFPHVLQVRVVTPKRTRWNYIYGFTVYYVEPVSVGIYEEYEYDAGGSPTVSQFIYEQAWKAPSSNNNVSDGHFIESSHPDARAYLYFTGANTLTLYGLSSSSYGVMDIFINGKLKGQFVEKGKRGYNYPFTISSLDSEAINVLELRIGVLPKMKPRMALDSVKLYNRPLLLGGNSYENNGLVFVEPVGDVPALQFSGQWTEVEDENASEDTYHIAASAYDEVVFDVRDATSVAIYRRLYKKYGKADVYVDGVYHSSFDNYTASPKTGVYQEPIVIGGLEQTFIHHVSIRASTDSKFKPFDVDYIEVRQAESQGTTFISDNFYENDDLEALLGQAIVYSGDSWVKDVPSPENPNSPTYAEAKTKGDRAMVVFFGNTFSVFFNRFKGGGKAAIYIDGDLMGQVDTRSGLVKYDVAFSVGGLKAEMHTAEIILRSRAMRIDGYRADTLTPDELDLSYDMVDDRPATPQNTPLFLMSGDWTVNGDYLQSKEPNARLSFYITGADSLFILRQALRSAGNLEVYVNGQLRATAEGSYLKNWPLPDETYITSGMHDMLTKGTWVELRVPQKKLVSLSEVSFGELDPLGPGDDVEGEGAQVYPAGNWRQLPKNASADYSGGFYLQSNSRHSRLYIPVQNVTYVTVYRPVSRKFSDVDVYLDGTFWGTMVNDSQKVQSSVAYSIGPIPNAFESHVIELRPVHRTRDFGVDRVTCQEMEVLGPGYYENTDVAFTGIDPVSGTVVGPSNYFGQWTELIEDGASGGSLHQAKKRGDRLETVFDGNQITIYRKTAKTSKYTTAYVDGKAYPMYSKDKPGANRVPFTILLPTSGYHTLELVNNSGRFYFDAIEISNALPAVYDYYQEDHPQVYVNDNNLWDRVESPENSGGYHLVTKTKYTSIFFLFQGGRVTAYLTRGKNWGRVSAFLDGEFMDEIDLRQFDKKNRNAPDEPFYKYDLTHLSIGTHVLELRFEGRKTRGGKPRANFDVMSVDGALVPIPGEDNPPSDPDVGGGDPGELITVPREGSYEEARTTNGWVFSGGGTTWGQLKAGTHDEFGEWYGASCEYFAYTDAAGNDVYAEFLFAAEGFGFLYELQPSGGEAQLLVDGNPVTVIDMGWPVELWLQDAKFEFPRDGIDDPLDPNVIHSFRLVPVETFPGSGLGTGRIVVDRLDLPAYNPERSPDPNSFDCYYTPPE
jgi:hypothetical protein